MMQNKMKSDQNEYVNYAKSVDIITPREKW